MSLEKILVVDDEKEIADLLQDYLSSEGYQVKCAYDGEQALALFEQFSPDLALLDIMLPKIEGTEVCRVIRNHSSIPIIMLSAKKSDIDKILSLGLGADDYVTKPFSPSVLVARVKAQLRRSRINQQETNHLVKDVLHFGSLVIDLKGYTVSNNNENIVVSSKEFKVLEFLAKHPNQVLSKEQIYNHVWGYDEYGDMNTVTVHIRKLREKLEEDPANPTLIKTVWGVGYKFEVVR